MTLLLLLALQDLRAGAAVVDAVPPAFPVVVNGMFTGRTATKAHDPVEVRALALDDGSTRLVLAVVDSCMVPRDLIDGAKAAAAAASGVPAERMMVSATHTHSAPSAMGCLGSEPDPAYPAFLRERIAEALAKAVAALRPAEAGWASVQAPEHTYCRRWILRNDKVRRDPFGDATVRANMHPGYQHPDFVGPSGPVDAELGLLSVRARDGAPLAVLANFSMHYFDSPLISADYAGAFRRELEKAVGGVVLFTQGTSGDLMWMDYGSPKKNRALAEYSAGLTALAAGALKGVEHRAATPLAMREAKLRLGRRVPDAKRLEWARKLVDGLGGRPVKSQAEIYAREAIFLHGTPEVELKLQAVRVGEGALTAIPNEVFSLTGLKLKARSPLRTLNVALANGAEGYIPPPEQHELGGYTTWPARTAALEVGAEPKIVETLLALLEEVAGWPRRAFEEPATPYSRAVLAAKPAAYWRLGDLDGDAPRDASGNGKIARLHGRRALAVEGAVHFVDGKLTSELPLGERWTVSFRVWRGHGHGAVFGDLAFNPDGRLTLGAPTGATALPLRTWGHVAVVRSDGRTRAWLNGEGELDVEGPGPSALVLGAGLEGRLDEAAVWDRALSSDEIRAHAALAN
jgi:hypothetical protein